jgi:type II secretory pathway pseudopilin PulG
MTFIEMMVVMAIIGLVGGVVAININKAMAEQRFRTEVAAIVNQLQLAQNLMLILNQDVRVTFIKDIAKKEINFGLQMQCPSVKGWDKELVRKPPPLRAVLVDFTGEDNRSSNSNELSIKFMSGGAVMSEGMLRLYSASGGHERFIYLPGFPAPIFASTEKQVDLLRTREQDRNFNNQLTQSMTMEVIAKAQATRSSTRTPENNESQPNPSPPSAPASRPSRNP